MAADHPDAPDFGSGQFTVCRHSPNSHLLAQNQLAIARGSEAVFLTLMLNDDFRVAACDLLESYADFHIAGL